MVVKFNAVFIFIIFLNHKTKKFIKKMYLSQREYNTYTHRIHIFFSPKITFETQTSKTDKNKKEKKNIFINHETICLAEAFV